MILDRPNDFGRVPIVLDRPNSFWSGPNHFWQVQIIKLNPEKSNLMWPKWFGPDQNNLYPSKTIWTFQNHFGPIEGKGICIFKKNKSVPIFFSTGHESRINWLPWAWTRTDICHQDQVGQRFCCTMSTPSRKISQIWITTHGQSR